MIPVEGSQVSYIGDEVDGLRIGDRGLVLASGASASHVRLTTGASLDTIKFLVNSDLVTTASAPSWDTSPFENHSMVGISVRATYEDRGVPGLVNALDRQGYLASMLQVGEEALGFVASKLRQDPVMREVMSQLEVGDDEDFLWHMAERVLKSASLGED